MEKTADPPNSTENATNPSNTSSESKSSAVFSNISAFARAGYSAVSTQMSVASAHLSDALEKGRQAREDPDGGYQFGDLTRGLYAKATTPLEQAVYGVWGDEAESQGEFGPILRPKGYSTPLERPDDGAATVYEVLKNTVEKFKDKRAVGSRRLLKAHKVEVNGKTLEKLELENEYTFLTYGEYSDRIARFACGLTNLIMQEPVDANRRLVLYAETQQDWMVAALAAFSVSFEVVTIYATLGEEGALFGFNQTCAPLCVVDTKLLKILTKIAPNCPSLKHVITMGGCDETSKQTILDAGVKTVSTLEELVSKPGDPLHPQPPKPDDIAVIMYTSGTTGAPKGVLLTHKNLTSACAGFHQFAKVAGIDSQDVFLAYLPLAHIMEMIAEISVLMLGACMGYGNPHTLTSASGVKLKTPESEGDCTVLKPTFMVFAPAVFDKIYKGVSAKVAAKDGFTKAVFEKALEMGMKGYDGGGIGVNPVLNLAFREIQNSLGGRVRFAVTGSAPLSPEIQRFMQTVLKAPVRQGYGLTENCACGTVGAVDDNAVKSVGGPVPCTVIRLADWPEGGYLNSDKDKSEIGMPRGEVLVGGPSVCMGYFVGKDGDPEIEKKNVEEFVTIDGIRYFRTGDIGQVNLKNGTLQIIDRKKDLWKGPQGEYVALSKVEAALKLCPYVDIPMVYGRTGGEFPVALVCVSEAVLRTIEGIPTESAIKDLCADERVNAEVMKSVRQKCKEQNLNEFEIPKKLALLAPVEGIAAWTPENDLLTAAMKLKRPAIVKAFSAEIDALYAP